MSVAVSHLHIAVRQSLSIQTGHEFESFGPGPKAWEFKLSSKPMTLEELTAQRDVLLAARYRAVRTVEIDGRRITYASDTEMAAAITDLERRIALGSSAGRRRRILTSASKGL